MGLEGLVEECEKVATELDEISKVLDEVEKRLRRCSWRLSGLRGEASKVKEVEGLPLNEARLDVAADSISKASARALKLSERVGRASLEVKAFVVECLQLARRAREAGEGPSK